MAIVHGSRPFSYRSRGVEYRDRRPEIERIVPAVVGVRCARTTIKEFTLARKRTWTRRRSPTGRLRASAVASYLYETMRSGFVCSRFFFFFLLVSAFFFCSKIWTSLLGYGRTETGLVGEKRPRGDRACTSDFREMTHFFIHSLQLSPTKRPNDFNDNPRE